MNTERRPNYSKKSKSSLSASRVRSMTPGKPKEKIKMQIPQEPDSGLDEAYLSRTEEGIK